MIIALLAATIIPFCAPENALPGNACMVSIGVDTTAAITMSAPPCGTPEAAKAKTCLRWRLEACPPPPPSYFPPKGPSDEVWYRAFTPAMPVGCEDTWRGWR